MVNIPFVDENFQRAYRNTFPSQTSSGRDLHVSDVVIPVVDFTPTTSGTSIPFDLLSSLNLNTTKFTITSGVDTTIITNTGFFRCNFNFQGSAAASGTIAFTNDGGTTRTEVELMECNNTIEYTRFIFNRVGFTTLFATSSVTGSNPVTVSVTPVADVNGNLLQPNGYSPQ